MLKYLKNYTVSANLIVLIFYLFIINSNRYFASNISISNKEWILSGGEGYIYDSCICLIGNGIPQSYNYYLYENVYFKSNNLYSLKFEYRTDKNYGEGCATSGNNLVNLDLKPEKNWTSVSYFIQTPGYDLESFIRFGQWELAGQTSFRSINIISVKPFYTQYKTYSLGYGEYIINSYYFARMVKTGQLLNGARFLDDYTAFFNTDRWMFRSGQYVIFKHKISETDISNANVQLIINSIENGMCLVEVSGDKRSWKEIGRITEISHPTIEIDNNILISDSIFIRISGVGEQCNFSLNDYIFSSKLKDDSSEVWGQTVFVEDIVGNSDSIFHSISFNTYKYYNNNITVSFYKNFLRNNMNIELEIINQISSEKKLFTLNDLNLIDNYYKLNFDLIDNGINEVFIMITNSEDTLYQGRMEILSSEIYNNNFGYAIEHNDCINTWWCEPDYKIGLFRPVPSQNTYKPIIINSAKNEYESFQIVINPKQDIDSINIKTSDFISNNDTLYSDNIEVFEIGYINVQTPSDRFSLIGFWPDPLMRINYLNNFDSQINKPIWIRVFVPEYINAGDYFGIISLSNDDFKMDIPVELHVWNFKLNEVSHIKTSFGLDINTIKEYHHIETDEQLDEILQYYYTNFCRHRINPYNPLKPIEVTIDQFKWVGGNFDTIESFSGNRSFRIEDWDNENSLYGYYDEYFMINDNKYILKWYTKTLLDNQSYLVSINFYDENKNWINGENIDNSFIGKNYWKQDSIIINPSSFPSNAKYFRLLLRPVLWTSEGELTGSIWFDEISLLNVQEEVNLLKNPGFEWNLDEFNMEINFNSFDSSYKNCVNNYNFNVFILDLKDFSWGTFAEFRPGEFLGHKFGSLEYEMYFGAYLGIIEQHLQDLEIIDNFYIFWFDEPCENDYGLVIAGMEFLQNFSPTINRFLTEQPSEFLFDYVDIWCPVTSNYDFVEANSRQILGDEVWWYVCTGPKSPYCNLFIDHSGIEPRIWIWQTWKYKIDGINHWCVNFWKSRLNFNDSVLFNPYQDPMSYLIGYQKSNNYISYWGNGDGRLLYPPKQSLISKEVCFQQPNSSIRWELLREGLEDYEYFWILDSIINQNNFLNYEYNDLLSIDETIIYNLKKYTKDPKKLFHRRILLANIIEYLSNREYH